MCTETLFKIASVLNQHRYNPIDELIKMWYTHTREFYSVIQKNEIMPLARKIDTIKLN